MDIYLKELQEALTPEYTTMLLQGILMCLWYDLDTTMTILEQTGTTDSFLQSVFGMVPKIKEDFEIKRFVIGLSSFLVM